MASSNFWGPKCHKTPSTYSLGEMLEKNEPIGKGPKSSQKNPPVSCNHYLGLGSVCVACLCCLGVLLGSCAKLALEQLAKEEKSYATRSGM